MCPETPESLKSNTSSGTITNMVLSIRFSTEENPIGGKYFFDGFT